MCSIADAPFLAWKQFGTAVWHKPNLCARDTNWFHSDLHLLLDRNVGILMSFNSAGSDGASDSAPTVVFRAFLARYFPYSPPPKTTFAHPQVDAARVAGWYEPSRRITSALSMINSFLQTIVLASPDGTVRVAALTDLSGTPLRWREVGPLTYREIGGQTHLKFVADPKGRILAVGKTAHHGPAPG
jgi:hypothetical protein